MKEYNIKYLLFINNYLDSYILRECITGDMIKVDKHEIGMYDISYSRCDITALDSKDNLNSSWRLHNDLGIYYVLYYAENNWYLLKKED